MGRGGVLFFVIDSVLCSLLVLLSCVLCSCVFVDMVVCSLCLVFVLVLCYHSCYLFFCCSALSPFAPERVACPLFLILTCVVVLCS